MVTKMDPDGSNQEDMTQNSDHNMPEQYFDIPSRDFSKEPASLGEKISTTAKMVAEPYARIMSKAYKKIRGN